MMILLRNYFTNDKNVLITDIVAVIRADEVKLIGTIISILTEDHCNIRLTFVLNTFSLLVYSWASFALVPICKIKINNSQYIIYLKDIYIF